jgi:hypothetical protein
MKKLTLDLDALRVDSFETDEDGPYRGTVQGQSDTDMHRVCTTPTNCETDVSHSTCMAGTCPGSEPCFCGSASDCENTFDWDACTAAVTCV